MNLAYVDLFRALLLDLGVCKRTSQYILTRLSNEGLHFITNVLPSFSKHLLSCIEQGFWSNFGSAIETHRGLPVIFRGYLGDVFYFDRRTNIWRSKGYAACPVAIFAIRQACEYVYKLALPFTADELTDNTTKFVLNDESVTTAASDGYENQFIDSMRSNFESNYTTAFAASYRDCSDNSRPGPGTTSRCSRTFWMRNYEAKVVSPFLRSETRGRLSFNRRAPLPLVSTAVVDSSRLSELLFVPKDARGPRTIVREPYSNLQHQMGFNTVLSRALERDTSWRINFESQEFNRSLAQHSSIDKSLCTLDLKDASDRVSFAVVRHVFRSSQLLSYILDFRSTHVILPDGRVHPLRKLSGMGSGFTFPTMALVIHLAICTELSKRTSLTYRQAMKLVYVYGDDIILPRIYRNYAVSALQRVGLAVNLSKSYSNSFFRESCGGDFYLGNDVAPARLKLKNAQLEVHSKVFTFKNKDFFLLGLERHCRVLVDKQLFNTAELIYKYLETELGKLPDVSSESSILGRLVPRSVVLDQIEYDAFGNAKKAYAYVPVVVKDWVDSPCPYVFLEKSLDKVAGDKEVERIESIFGEASLPRKIKIVKRKLSSFARS